MMHLNPKLNVVTSVKKYIDTVANKSLKDMLEKDILATNIYTLGYYSDSYSNWIIQIKLKFCRNLVFGDGGKKTRFA